MSPTMPLSTTAENTPGRSSFLRTKDGCYRLIDSKYWGSYYIPIKDPKGVDAPDDLDHLRLRDNFDKLPFEMLMGIITFFRHYVRAHGGRYSEGTTEVSVCLLRSETDPSVWKVVVPLQEVTSATVDATTEQSCDLFTGEEYTVFPPEGFLHAGSMHSHGAMPAFWSGRDDMGELEVPGMHCTVGQISSSSFSICSSIVLNQRRYIFDPTTVLQIPPECSTQMHTPHRFAVYKPSTKAITVTCDNHVSISDKCHTYVITPKPKFTTPNYAQYGAWRDDFDLDSNRTLGWTVGQRTKVDRLSDVKRLDLASELEYVRSADRNPIVNAELYQSLKELDRLLERLRMQPMGEELIAVVVAQQLDLPVSLPQAEEIVNGLLD